MARLAPAGTTAFITFLLGTTSLHADITPEQVWESWQKQYAAYGFEVAPGSVNRNGDMLEIRNVVFTAEMADSSAMDNTRQGSRTVLTVPALLLQDQGDGTVKASVEGEITGTNETAMENGATEIAAITLRKTEATAIISGTPEAMSYAIDAPSLSMEVKTQPPAGDTAAAPAQFSMTLNGLSGTQEVVVEGSGQGMKTNLKVKGMTMSLIGADDESGSTVNAGIEIADLAIRGNGMMPEGADSTNPGNALGLGMIANSEMSYGKLSYKMDASTETGPVTLSGSADAGQATIALSREAFRYAASGQNTVIDMQTADFPVPLNAQIAQGSFDFALPLAASAEPQPFTAKVGLEGVAMSEQIWAMLDPQGHLGHGPATLIVDLTGKAKALVDLFSPEAAQSPVPPMEIDSLTVNKLQLTAAGADLTGQGAMTFDNSAGMPMPLGAIELRLAGANKVMDGLVAMGLMPQDQVMFAKMMMGMYAVPAGDDVMTSKIEFQDGGRILANGQPIQ